MTKTVEFSKGSLYRKLLLCLLMPLFLIFAVVDSKGSQTPAVTANLYIPKGMDKPVPAILYVCGHGSIKKNGISYGNKARYQHHGAWFARHGYVCLIIDSLQLGEIQKRQWQYILGVRMRRCQQVKEIVLSRSGRYQEVVAKSDRRKAPAPLKVKEVSVEGRRYIVYLNED
jgi:hypothetical protein